MKGFFQQLLKVVLDILEIVRGSFCPKPFNMCTPGCCDFAGMRLLPNVTQRPLVELESTLTSTRLRIKMGLLRVLSHQSLHWSLQLRVA